MRGSLASLKCWDSHKYLYTVLFVNSTYLEDYLIRCISAYSIHVCVHRDKRTERSSPASFRRKSRSPSRVPSEPNEKILFQNEKRPALPTIKVTFRIFSYFQNSGHFVRLTYFCSAAVVDCHKIYI